MNNFTGTMMITKQLTPEQTQSIIRRLFEINPKEAQTHLDLLMTSPEQNIQNATQRCVSALAALASQCFDVDIIGHADDAGEWAFVIRGDDALVVQTFLSC